MKEFERVEVLDAGGLDKAHENLMVAQALAGKRAVAERNLAHNDARAY